jgi:thioredoxin reductase
VRLVIIGAGPVGLAAALGGVQRGWDVSVLESDEVGTALRRWGATRFFSPLGMNLPPGTREILGRNVPDDESILTGPEFADNILGPLAQSDALAGRIKVGHRVVAVGRAGLTRCDFAGHPIRSERAFRLLVDTPQGEKTFEADSVIDASGTYGQPVAIGFGGMPAPGERSLAQRPIRDLGELHAIRDSMHGKRILLTGHGHSAANAILVLAEIAEQAPETQIVWACRSFNQRPCVEVPSDPLPERQQVVAQANQLAMRPPGWLTMQRRASVESLANEDGASRVALSGGRVVVVDEIVALNGYRPDLSFLSELPIDIAPVTEGSGRLARALANVTDCLSVPSLTPADLDTGESGFHLAGAKSYGRARTFLLKNGYAQLHSMLDRLESNWTS